MGEFYLSLDVETGGPCPGINPLLQLGAVAFSADGKELGSFSANLKQGSYQWDQDTRLWWDDQIIKNPKLEEQVFGNPMKIVDAMQKFDYFVIEMSQRTGAKCVPVAWPAGFDYPFVKYYMHKYRGSNRLGISCLCIKSYIMAALNKDYRDTVKRNIPKSWLKGGKHTHNATDDAREQGLMFLEAKKYVELAPRS